MCVQHGGKVTFSAYGVSPSLPDCIIHHNNAPTVNVHATLHDPTCTYMYMHVAVAGVENEHSVCNWLNLELALAQL